MFKGKQLADVVLRDVRHRIQLDGLRPKLAAILIGSNPSSKVYLSHKERACADVGIDSEIVELSEHVSNAVAERVIQEYSNRTDVHGILLQLPLPNHLDERFLCNVIPFDKDVDGLSPKSIGNLVYGQSIFVPPTASAVCHTLAVEKINTFGAKILIAGRSRHVGLPIALLLQGFRTHPDLPMIGEATISLAHRHTSEQNLIDMARKSDVIISATGVPGLIKPDMVKNNAVLIDVGFTRKLTTQGRIRLMGDVHPSCKELASLMTPVPGGIGPLTIAHLCRNTLNAYLSARDKPLLPLASL